jgi:hypothetical protein
MMSLEESINKRQQWDYTHKTVHIVYAATQQNNFHILYLLTFYRLYFIINNDQVNILIY